jgi:hypothetical protein
MSDRDYFSLKYTVPGFALILVIIGLNYKPMLFILSRQGTTDVLGLAISILTLFASSAIGFLISQIWFAWFHHKRIYARLLEEQNVQDYMATAYHWKPKEKSDKVRDEIMATAIDYILNCEVQNDKLFGFIQRKIDLFHTMSCAWVSLSFGLAIGLLFRGLAWWSSGLYVLGLDLKLDCVLFAFTSISAIFLVLLLRYYLTKKIFVEYHPMLKLFLNSLTTEKKTFSENLKQVFPEYIKCEEIKTEKMANANSKDSS